MLAMVAMVCGTAILMAQGAASKARPTKVAVVDVRKLFNALEERDKMEADLNVMDQKIVEEKKVREAKLNDMATDLKMVGNSDADFERMTEALERAHMEHGNWLQWQQKRRTRESRLRVLDLYRRIAKAIEDASVESGYDLVLYKDDIDLDSIKPDEVNALITSRRVLYSAADMDITDAITTRMNNAFRNNVQR